MPDGNSFEEIAAGIAARKKRFAAARSEANDKTKESSRGVYLAGCKAVAGALLDDGLTYTPSAQKSRRKIHDFTFEISFQSSQLNVHGELVALWIHAHVFSPTLKIWRQKTNARNQSDFVAGGQIGNLVGHPSWLEWNLADASAREAMILDAVDTVRRIAYPYFAAFEDIPGLVRRLATGDLPALDFGNKLDILLCFGSQADLLETAAKLFQVKPEERIRFGDAVSRFREEGLPAAQLKLTAPGEILAAAAITYGLPGLLIC
jgi:hypothetical protein